MSQMTDIPTVGRIPPPKASSFKEFSIPLNRPSVIGREFEYIAKAIETGKISGDGTFTRKCHDLLKELTGARKVLLTTSCTHALEMSAFLTDIQPGDEVIVPSFTFVSTVNAFVIRGAKPIFADIRPDTLNLDETTLEDLVTPNTKAIVPVHYAGVACEMDVIRSVAGASNLSVIEDNAHGLLGRYKGEQLGSLGRMATLSFHETKNFQCGEGGALLINDDSLIERAEILREKGTNRSKFFRGQVDKYTWIDFGSSYLPSDLLAAFLLAQLEQHAKIQSRRKRIWDKYMSALKDWAAQNSVTLPHVPKECEQSYHMFYLLMPSLEIRQEFMDTLAAQGILATYHYIPLHSSPMGEKLDGRRFQCPVTDSVSERLVRLPFFTSISDDEHGRVIDAVLRFKA